jgi:coenzyme F420 hydrogenase subunit beta
MMKMNIKGEFQIWMRDGSYHDDLEEGARLNPSDCKHFVAEDSEVSTGGIGIDNDSTLTVVSTEFGKAVVERMIGDSTGHRHNAPTPNRCASRGPFSRAGRHWRSTANDPAPSASPPRTKVTVVADRAVPTTSET